MHGIPRGCFTMRTNRNIMDIKICINESAHSYNQYLWACICMCMRASVIYTLYVKIAETQLNMSQVVYEDLKKKGHSTNVTLLVIYYCNVVMHTSRK